MATFPSGIKSFTTRVNNDVIEPAHVNDLQDEVNAVETYARSTLFSAVNSSAQPVGTSYVPVWGTLASAPTPGNATLSGRYLTIGKWVLFNLSFGFGSTSAAGTGIYTFTLPITPAAAAANKACGSGTITDISAGLYYGISCLISAGVLVMIGDTVAGGGVSNVVPITWADGDGIQVFGFYEGV